MKHSIRWPLLVVFAALAGAGIVSAQQSAQALADLLEERGMIAHADRDRIRAASAGDTVQAIASILSEKGLLSGADLARLGLPSPAAPATAALAPKPAAVPAASPGPVTTVSRVPFQVYGTLLLNGFYNTSLNNNEDIPLFAGKQGSDPTGGDKNFGMTVRQSRLGMRYSGLQLGDAKISGQVEFDFFGGQSTLSNGVGFDLFRLRLALGRVDWKNVSLVAGQDWSVFAPLNPTSLAGYSIPDFSASGNPWIRSPAVFLSAVKDGSAQTIP
jgi:hypothetical protein